MITKDSIENLKNSIDIVDIVSQFIPLKKNGANFKANCPFHGEKTPSFVVSPAKQIYHCFGCGVGGDAINFVKEYEKLSYPQAIEKLASMSNFTLAYDNNYKTTQLDNGILKQLNSYYQKQLSSNEVARKYLDQRGISKISIETFEIGYVSNSQNTIGFLKNSFLNLNTAKELGVVDGDRDLYARLVERITFPIYDTNSKLVGFGGRTITNHSAKYINSPQTKLFNKSRLLYGYHIAKQTIFKNKQIIITEGYLDVIMLHQAGFSQSVATLGTALTSDHLPTLKRGEPKIILAYDGDKAGQNAAFKASMLLGQQSFEGGVVLFKDGVDPADMVQNNKIQELNSLFNSPVSFVVYCINHIVNLYDLQVPIQKQKAIKELKDFLQTLSPILQEEYSRYIARILNINERFINTKSYQMQQNQSQKTILDIAELSLIRTILDDEMKLNMVLDVLDKDMFEYHKAEFEMVLNDKNNPALRGILLQDELKIYNNEELKQQLLNILVKFYEKKLSLVKLNNTDFTKSAKFIRKIKDNIKNLKQGRLVSYNL